MLKFLLLGNTQVLRENRRLWSVLRQPAVGGVAHDRQRPRASIDGTEALDATESAQRRILHDVFGIIGIAGEPSCETISFSHVRQKDFIERCAIIPVLHNWDRRLGYVTVTPDLHFEVSRRIKEEFDNGRHYYELHGKPIFRLADTLQRPDPEALRWHNEHAFRG